MAFEAFFPKITLPAGDTDIRKGNGIGMIVKGRCMLVDAFDGGEATNGLIAWFKSKNVVQIDLAVVTHAHSDHWGGIRPIVNAGIPIKEFRCYHPDSIRDGNAASREDSDNLLELIRWLQARGTRVLFVDHGDTLQFEDVSWHIYRNQPKGAAAKDDPNAWSYVNDGSLVLCSPELKGILPGDGPEELKAAIAYFQKLFGKTEILEWLDIPHHGGSCSRSNSESADDAGCKLAYESCVEASGPGMTEWTQYGARRVKQQGIPVLMQDKDIYITAAMGKITFAQGNSKKVMDVPYTGKFEAGWVKNATGWWYKKEDGSFCKGWCKCLWSQEKENGDWFFFDEKGYMQTGWIKWKGKWYFLDLKDGYMWHDTWLDWKGRKCYLTSSGAAAQGVTMEIGGKPYTFDSNAYLVEDTGASQLNGVDVASYQAGINPAAMTTTDFVIVKMTQGTWYINPAAEKQYTGAKSAGKLLGAYHYAEGKDAVQEAEYFVKTLGDRVGECVLALDWEGHHNYVFGTGKDVKWCLAWLNEVYRLTRVRPLIYMSKSVCRKYDWSSVSKHYALWCAQYGSNSSTDYQDSPWTDSNGFGAWSSDTIRQYSSHGSKITGYSRDIDINKAYMTADQWRAMASGKAATDPIDAMVEIMEGEIGCHEGANNWTKYGDEMHALQPRNMDKNAAWCDSWFDWCVLQLCKRYGKDAETARQVLCGDFDDYTYNSVALYKKAGRWTQTPARGYQIFFGGAGHTGGVVKVDGGIVYTIEGNKSDQVKACQYKVGDSSIIGYGRPRYELLTGGTYTVTADDMPLIKQGSTGSAVTKLQEMLNKLGAGLEVDGDFGPKTLEAVKAFQKKAFPDDKTQWDGEVGPITWAALIEATK